MAYDEQTLTHPRERWEVYGQDGFGWYTFTEDAEAVKGRMRGVTLELSTNPTFTYLRGATRRKLVAKGFMS